MTINRDHQRIQLETERRMSVRQQQVIEDLRAENEQLRAALTEIMQGARSLDYAIHLARAALANASSRVEK